MAQLNVTWNGVSVDAELNLDFQATDGDVKRIALEMLRTGGLPGLVDPDVAENAFVDYMVDRLRNGVGEERLFLRPKTPFGHAG